MIDGGPTVIFARVDVRKIKVVFDHEYIGPARRCGFFFFDFEDVFFNLCDIGLTTPDFGDIMSKNERSGRDYEQALFSRNCCWY